jgi:hypothetical protein
MTNFKLTQFRVRACADRTTATGERRGEGHGIAFCKTTPCKVGYMARPLVGDMSQPRGRPMMTARCSEASAAPSHGAACDAEGERLPSACQNGSLCTARRRKRPPDPQKAAGRRTPILSSGQPRRLRMPHGSKWHRGRKKREQGCAAVLRARSQPEVPS